MGALGGEGSCIRPERDLREGPRIACRGCACTSGHAPGPQMFVTGIVGVVLVLVAFLCLPAVVMVPLLIVFLARRSISISQIRAGLASTKAQIKLLSQTTKAPPGGPPT